jgi:hypothetical protein
MPRSTPTITPSPALAQTGQPCTPAQPSGEPQPGTAGKVGGITREMRQDAAVFLAALHLGLSTQEADQLVAGMQARRRELSGVHGVTVAPKVESRTVLLVE